MDIIKFLVENKAEINLKVSSSLWTPLHYCAQNYFDNLETFGYLLEKKAKLDSINSNFKYPHNYFRKFDKNSLLILLTQQEYFFVFPSKEKNDEDDEDDILSSDLLQLALDYQNGVLWNKSSNKYFPSSSQQLVFHLLLCFKIFSKKFKKNIIPKPLIFIIIQNCFSNDNKKIKIPF